MVSAIITVKTTVTTFLAMVFATIRTNNVTVRPTLLFKCFNALFVCVQCLNQRKEVGKIKFRFRFFSLKGTIMSNSF